MLFLCRVVARCFFNKTAELVHLLTGCSKQVKEVKPKMFFVNGKLFLRARLFWKRIRKRSNFIDNLAVLDFEFNCLQDENFKDTDTRKGLRNYFFSSVFISSNLVDRPFFLLIRWSSSPGCYFQSSSQKVNFPWQSTNEILFFDLEKVVILRLGRVFETLSQRHSRNQWITEHEKRVHSRTQWWAAALLPNASKNKRFTWFTFRNFWKKKLWPAACFWFSQCKFR